MRAIILLAFLCIGCESYQDLTIYNHAFDGTITIDTYSKHLSVGEHFTIPIDEGVYTIDILSDSIHEYRDRKYRVRIYDKAVVYKGHNEYIIRKPIKQRLIKL